MGRNRMPPAAKGLTGAKKGDTEEGFQEDRRTEPLIPPKELEGTQKWVWDNVIQPAWWLQPRDVIEAFAYTCLTARLIDEDFDATATRIEAWRKLAAVLCLTTQEQQRAGIVGKTGPDEPSAEGGKIDFFGSRG